MFATAVVVFREVLEAALVIGLMLAAARELPRRGLWVGTGLAAGAGGSIVVAVFAGAIASAVAGMGQEVFNAGILFTAVLMLGWHNVWMARHGADMAREIKAVGHDVAAGLRPHHVIATVVGLAVLREGSEVVLFLYSIAVAQQEDATAMWIGAVAGLAAGGAMGVLLYFGLLRMAARYLFKVVSWLIALLAAGMAAQGAGFLVQADLLSGWIDPVWDTSGMLSEKSVFGRVLQALIGYIDRPSATQILFYIITLAAILALSRLYGGPSQRVSGPSVTTRGSNGVVDNV
jgi:high-affinity iron transporter